MKISLLKNLTTLGALTLCLLFSQDAFSQKKLNKVKNAPLHAGEARTFESPYKATIKYARSACTESGLVLESTEEIDEDTYMILAKAKVSAFSWGEIVRVVIEKKSESKSVVRVYTKKRVGLNVAAKGNYSNTIFSNVESKVEFGD